MKPNAERGVVAVVFLIAVIGAYLVGKGTGGREAVAEAERQAGGSGRSGSSLAGLASEKGQAGGTFDPNNPNPEFQPSVKAIIGRARVKMQGGMMNMSGMMRALELLDSISDEQIQEALAEVERSVKEPQQKMMFGMLLLARWAETDGPAALAYAEENFSSKNPMMMGMRTGVISAWAQSDPEAAWDWYQEQGPDIGDGRSTALMGIVGSLAMNNVDKAFERLESLEDPSERQMAMQGIGQAIWDEGRRAEILTKIETMEDAAEKATARSEVISQWALIDPDGAIEWADTLPDDVRSAVVKQIGQSLSWADPQRSGELMLSVATTPEERSAAYSNAVSSWAYNDPNGAGKWLGQQDQGPELDQARQQFAVSVAQKDPQGAMAWADAITDDKNRTNAVQNVYLQWAGRDRAPADEALAGTNLNARKITELKAMDIKAGTAAHGNGIPTTVGKEVTTEAVAPDEKSAVEVPEAVPEQ